MKRQMGITSIMVLICILSSGCVPLLLGAAAGATGVVWYNGEAKSTYERPLGACWDGAKKAFSALKINVTEESNATDELKRTLHGSTPGGDKVSVHFKSLTTGTTEIGIRVGVFGDKEQSARIHEEIRKQLGIQ